ncbi:MAG: hypothetical protein OEX18_13830 [Candidatus Krumholzibacteria bacterium]|nr:hypothetical protein [Candidatus Krumholzibacteria bacterium]MDH4338347.1 hypothetical protein [Candidatus Krumholzibacteria bacterium]MDH5270763.1 hypothetical protein [Candidatus Krumholzibacteria bacterium]MDH5628396.1 hypothetical protein [Candidatus Krumholzibacteria bacterium]
MGTLFRISAPLLSFALLAGLVSFVLPAEGVARPKRNPADPGAVVSQQGEKEEKKDAESAGPGGPMDVFGDIELGWKSGNVDLILRHFGTQKVAISVEGTGPSGGTFSRNQSYYLLKDLFRYTITREFEFAQYRKPGEQGGRSYAIWERQYQKSDDGRLIKDKVYVSLHLESDGNRQRWVVDEIKSIR